MSKSNPSWWQWPADKGHNYAPWYTIAWRLLWSPFFYTGAFMVIGATLCAFGRDAADDMMEYLL